jgi:hypothetical protein
MYSIEYALDYGDARLTNLADKLKDRVIRDCLGKGVEEVLSRNEVRLEATDCVDVSRRRVHL